MADFASVNDRSEGRPKPKIPNFDSPGFRNRDSSPKDLRIYLTHQARREIRKYRFSISTHRGKEDSAGWFLVLYRYFALRYRIRPGRRVCAQLRGQVSTQWRFEFTLWRLRRMRSTSTIRGRLSIREFGAVAVGRVKCMWAILTEVPISPERIQFCANAISRLPILRMSHLSAYSDSDDVVVCAIRHPRLPKSISEARSRGKGR